MKGFDSTLQKFIYKYTVDLENVQRIKKKKGRTYMKHQKLAQTRFDLLTLEIKSLIFNLLLFLLLDMSPICHIALRC